MADQPTADVIDLAIVRTLKQRVAYLEHQVEAAHTVGGHLIEQIEELKAERDRGATVLPLIRTMSAVRA